MKTAIVYKSVTGNTDSVAQAIKEALSDEEIVYLGEPKNDIEAEIYFVGSWTDKGMCCHDIAEFLKGLENEHIAYFGTAGFGGSQEYYEALYSRIKAIIPESNTLLGKYFCQGKMPVAVRERYVSMLTEHPDDKKLQVSVENFDKALSHPDSKDLSSAGKWACDVIGLAERN